MHPADHPGPMVFVDDLDAPVLSEGDRHHLVRVLRLRAGDSLVLGDGRGRWCTSTLGGHLEPRGPIREAAPSVPALTVGFALVKRGKPEVIVQKLTELGIDRIVPFQAERSVVRWDDDKAAKAVERLRLVAREAAMQCHRPHLPEVAALAELRDLAREPGAALADRGGSPLTAQHRLVLVGPEGGWAPDERPDGVPTVTLAVNVLRAETAAIVAGALMSTLRGAIV